MKKIIGMFIVIFAVSGCMSPQQDDVAKTQESMEKVNVVASFYPLAYMAERIGGEQVTVTNIVGAADPHDYTPSPQDIVTMHNADVFIMQGAGFESWGEDVAAQLESEEVVVVEVADNLQLIERTEEDAHEDEHHEEEGEHHEEDEYYDEEDAHDHGMYDPHTWLDPMMAQDMVNVVADALIEADATNASMYQENASSLREEFALLDADFAEGLSVCSRRDVIVSHNAFGYLAQHYGFTTHAIAGLSTQDEPSASVLAELKEEMSNGITHILTEENAVQRFAQTLSDETGLIMLPVNTLAAPSNDGADFFDRARNNLEQFEIALGCGVQ